MPRGWVVRGDRAPPAASTNPFSQYDWPLPKQPSYPLNMRGWIGRVIASITPAKPFAQYDWPLPKAAIYPISMVGWIDYPRYDVIVTAAPFAQYDWPLPQRLPYPISMVGWIDYPRYDVIVPIVVYVPRAATYALPRQPYYPVDRRGWITQAIRVAAAVQAPFNQYDWPLPRAVEYPARLRGFIDFDSFGPAPPVQAPFSQYDWPQPRIAAQRADRGWIASFNPATVSFNMGFNTYDWPMPRAAYYPYFKSGGQRMIVPPPSPPVTTTNFSMPFFATPGQLKSW